ncbi:MAG: inositol monophosphatase [Acidimicrobiia bacterium]
MSADLELAHRLADAADAIARRYFATDSYEVQTKADGSPVTIADQTIEETIKATLAAERPGDGVLGEEVGPSGPADPRWILDGIDGTHNFAAGRTEWGTLIARQQDGEIVLGVVTSPAMGRRWWVERGGGAWTATMAEDGSLGEPQPMHCSDTGRLADAVVSGVPGMAFFKDPDDWRVPVAAAVLRGDVQPTAFGHSALRVAAGETDATLHLHGGVWDHAVGVVFVEEAGGRFADLWGGRRLDTKTAVFANAAVFDEVMAALRAALPEGSTPPDPLP